MYPYEILETCVLKLYKFINKFWGSYIVFWRCPDNPRLNEFSLSGPLFSAVRTVFRKICAVRTLNFFEWRLSGPLYFSVASKYFGFSKLQQGPGKLLLQIKRIIFYPSYPFHPSYLSYPIHLIIYLILSILSILSIKSI